MSDHGFAASYQAVKRFVRKLRGPQCPEAMGIILTPPGEEGLVDYCDDHSLLHIKTDAGVSNLWSQPIKGGTATQITHFNGEIIYGFSLSPDGKQLLLSRGRDSSDVVLIRDVK